MFTYHLQNEIFKSPYHSPRFPTLRTKKEKHCLIFMGKFVPVEVIKACGEVEVKFHSFLTSTVYRLSGQFHAPAASQAHVRRPPCPLCRRL